MRATAIAAAAPGSCSPASVLDYSCPRPPACTLLPPSFLKMVHRATSSRKRDKGDPASPRSLFIHGARTRRSASLPSKLHVSSQSTSSSAPPQAKAIQARRLEFEEGELSPARNWLKDVEAVQHVRERRSASLPCSSRSRPSPSDHSTMPPQPKSFQARRLECEDGELSPARNWRKDVEAVQHVRERRSASLPCSQLSPRSLMAERQAEHHHAR